jgi:hypothetical protein
MFLLCTTAKTSQSVQLIVILHYVTGQAYLSHLSKCLKTKTTEHHHDHTDSYFKQNESAPAHFKFEDRAMGKNSRKSHTHSHYRAGQNVVIIMIFITMMTVCI